jgi:hypothetical protein
MTDTPLIRAARALALSDSGEDCFDALDPAMQEKLVESVRVVLGAVREPSEAMIEAANVADRGMMPWTGQYQAMIDALIENRP